jgi:predicted membrane channel-forming protein YqfA (hemolysin III family)
MKTHETRYWTMEHLVGMLIAIILITIGHSRSKRATTPTGKHKAIATFYTMGILVMLGILAASGRGIFGMTH